MRKFTAFMGVLVAALFAAGLVIGATAPEKVTIKEIQKSKPGVVFDHKAHTQRVKACAECHHKDAAGKEQNCFNCHKAKKEKDAPEFKEAMHGKCKACHTKLKKGPTKCNDCHKA